nr:MAG TPA: hypothetical protein [Caudoviricetes sp.]
MITLCVDKKLRLGRFISVDFMVYKRVTFIVKLILIMS